MEVVREVTEFFKGKGKASQWWPHLTRWDASMHTEKKKKEG
jgi:hypothetical protein